MAGSEAAMNMAVTMAPLVALRRLEIGFGPTSRPPVVAAFTVVKGRIAAIDLIMDPAKLGGLELDAFPAEPGKGAGA
jgi:hypothetical protein